VFHFKEKYDHQRPPRVTVTVLEVDIPRKRISLSLKTAPGAPT